MSAKRGIDELRAQEEADVKRLKGTDQTDSRQENSAISHDYDTLQQYRLQNVPQDYTKERLRIDLAYSLEMEPSDIIVHSLSNEPTRSNDTPSRTSTLSFLKKPTFLTGAVTTTWPITLSTASQAGSSNVQDTSVFIDQEFLGFTPLTPVGRQTTIDCIIMHGFGGHAIGSFREPKSRHLWIRDQLPHHIPELNVLTYGYPNPYKDPDSVQDMQEWAQDFRRNLQRLRKITTMGNPARPLLFIVHSLGGLILKEAIIDMKKTVNTAGRSIAPGHDFDRLNLLSTYAILFFGVPHQGMDVSSIQAMARNASTRQITSLLDRTIGWRLKNRQHEEFCNAFDFEDSRLIYFFEGRKTRRNDSDGEGVLLVEAFSASHGRKGDHSGGADTVFSIYSDHRNMVKFPQRKSSDYDNVRDILQGTVESAGFVIKARFSALGPHLEPAPPYSERDAEADTPNGLPMYLGQRIQGRGTSAK